MQPQARPPADVGEEAGWRILPAGRESLPGALHGGHARLPERREWLRDRPAVLQQRHGTGISDLGSKS